MLSTVVNGTYTNGELQSSSANYATAINSSVVKPGDEIRDVSYGYTYHRLSGGALNWVRVVKG